MLAATNPVAVLTIALVGGIVFGGFGALIRGNKDLQSASPSGRS